MRPTPNYMDKELANKWIEFKELKVRKNKEFITNNKNLFLVLDILIILAIIFNAGCLCLTNALVEKANPDVPLLESNPVASVVYDFNAAPILEGIKYIWYSIIIWAAVGSWYFYSRMQVTSYWGMSGMVAMTFFLFMMNFTNFMNDFGYLLGKVI